MVDSSAIVTRSQLLVGVYLFEYSDCKLYPTRVDRVDRGIKRPRRAAGLAG